MAATEARLDRHAAALEPALRSIVAGLEVEVLAEVDSTNTRLVERLRQGDVGARLLVAEHQSAGRGRNGRAWSSRPGASLTFSIGLPYAPVDWSGLSLAVGTAIADALEPLADRATPRLQVKWPNDLWLCDAPGCWRKLGGILVESVAIGEARGCVVGVGLNVLPRDDTAGLASGYASLREIDPTIDAAAALERVAAPLLSAMRRFERDGLTPFVDSYDRRDLLRGQRVQAGPPGELHGVAQGIDGRGALRLLGPGGVVAVHSGEVRVRPLVAEGD